MKKLLILLTFVTAIFLLASCAIPNLGGENNQQPPEECEHELIEGKSEAPTCTEDGYTAEQTCINCNEVVVASEVIPATGHPEDKIISIPAEEATCLKEGSTEGKKCLACNKNIVLPHAIPMLDHVVISTPNKEATCTTAGSTGGTHCAVCFTTIDQPTSVQQPFGHDRGLEHISVTIEAQASTCRDAGWTEELFCSKCNTVVISSKPLPLAEHKEEDLELAAGYTETCVADGLTDGYNCTYCGNVAVAQEVIPANPASHPEESVSTLAAIAVTCHSDGLTEGSHCSLCDKDVVAQEKVTERPAHALAVKVDENGDPIDAIAADCANGIVGRTAYMICTNDGCDHEEPSVELPYEHKLGDWVITIEPTTENAGQKEAVCSDCNHVEIVQLPAISDELDDIDPDGTI